MASLGSKELKLIPHQRLNFQILPKPELAKLNVVRVNI